MRPTTVVVSANLMMRLEADDAVKSGVNIVNRRGLSTQPCGALVVSVMVPWMVPHKEFQHRCRY